MNKINKYFPKFNRTLLKKCGRFFRVFLLIYFLVTLSLRFIPVPFSAYMVQEKIAHLFQLDFAYDTKYQWVSLDKISPYMQLAVIASEDQRFAQHYGLDLDAIEKALEHNQKSKRIRGASTITQQTAKNLYLWHGQSWLRKGIEIPVTFSLELLWSKQRILEVYLNIAEFGEGIFGVEAASQHYFKKSAKQLSKSEAALLTSVLPNPLIYKVDKPNLHTRKKQAWIMDQMDNLGLNYLTKL
ncbi:monofunctional biosynthetic peptidoglycan transglycosylase [Pasteurellaceae bacterium 22721_9_1]